MKNNGVPPSGSGSRPSDEAADGVSTVPASVPNAGGLSPFDPAKDMLPEPWRERIQVADREFRKLASRLWGCLFQRHIQLYRDMDALAVADATIGELCEIKRLIAQAIEARRAETHSGSVHESAVPSGMRPDAVATHKQSRQIGAGR